MMAVSDPSDLTQLRLSPHTTYHRNFFLLRVHLTINDQPAQISSDGGHLTIGSRYPPVSITFDSLTTEVETIVQNYGLKGVSNYWCEDVPLFELKVLSHDNLKRLLRSEERVQKELESRITAMLAQQSPEPLAVYADAEVYMLTPLPEGKDASITRITSENLAKCTTEWRESAVFNFGALFRAFRMKGKDILKKVKPPKITSQPTSQKDIIPGKAVAFSVQATGTEPLGYQWQWKQFGKKSEKDGWQNLSGGSGTFQVRSVKASHAGYYRCVVSNSAGSETSQHATLIVVPEIRDLDCELYEVIDWIPLGLRLGIKLPELKIIEANYPNDLKRCRIEMFEEWQKKMTSTWSAMVQALDDIGMRRLASELAQKHGTPPPKLSDNVPLDQFESVFQQKEEASMLHEELQKLRGDLKQGHRKLVAAEERLRQSQESKVKANERACEAVTKLEELQENVEKIVQEKKNLEMKLKVKERECQLLCTMQEEDEISNQFLKMEVYKKEEEIKSLKEELRSRNCELQSAVEEAQNRQKELSQAQKELKKQHEQVMQLQREKEELAWSYNIEKEQVSKIVQLLVSDKEEMQQQLSSMNIEKEQVSKIVQLLVSDKEEIQQQLSSMKEESELKLQQIETCNADLSEKIKALSRSLQEKEATAAQLQSKLEKREQVASTQLLGFIKLRVQIAELECRLQEAEEQKQQVELETGATVQETKVKESLKAPLHAHIDEPLKIINHPKSLSNISPGTVVSFTVEATEMDLPGYQWQWKPAEEEDEWHSCPAEWSDGATLTISSVQKSNEGWFRCVISNCAGTLISKPAQLSVADPPRVTSHPRDLKDVVPGKPVIFTTEAMGTEPLNYQWLHWKPAGKGGGSGEWQPCPAEWCDGAMLTIPSVQKSNEGSYCCVISNCAGSQTSEPASLSVADPPRVITHPQDLKDVVRGKHAKFTIQATGTEPLSYQWWYWKLAGEGGQSGEWQPCPAEWCDGATLTIPSVQKSNEGYYCCVISNCAGSQASERAKLETCPPLQLPLQLRWRKCKKMEYGMSVYPHSVVLERSVYVGGGSTHFDDVNEYIVLKYGLDTNNYSFLPRYDYRYFAISIINSRLTLVGGCDDGLNPTNQLAVYEPSSWHWTYPYHPMPTARYSPAVVMYNMWLLVAGGRAGVGRDLATVELLNTSTNQWLATTASLPKPCGHLTSAIINNFGYIVTDSKQVYRVSLPDIVAQAVDQSTASKSPALWRRLPDTPLSCSAAISLRGYLITMGGSHDNSTRRDIHLYQPEGERWTKVGDLPSVRCYCSCVVLPSGELLVAGGQENYVGIRRVEVAYVLD